MVSYVTQPMRRRDDHAIFKQKILKKVKELNEEGKIREAHTLYTIYFHPESYKK